MKISSCHRTHGLSSLRNRVCTDFATPARWSRTLTSPRHGRLNQARNERPQLSVTRRGYRAGIVRSDNRRNARFLRLCYRCGGRVVRRANVRKGFFRTLSANMSARRQVAVRSSCIDKLRRVKYLFVTALPLPRGRFNRRRMGKTVVTTRNWPLRPTSPKGSRKYSRTCTLGNIYRIRRLCTFSVV